ncbi:hypothetical protein LAZ67_2003373 [Cordylochernes scorpioides]|uniref:Uncharacterized protein n=1 Tax=Cordylochernes scorpioides TaxID=51811 RepID=A0ABY6K314_9ARAC|nr:hypothetical protein LAZ67_2003373 [Cordylochernes scorpioides]
MKKRAERIVIGNVPFFVENLDLVAALRPYGQITSIVQKMMELGESYWADARRFYREELLDTLASVPGLKNLKNKIESEQITALNNTAQEQIDALPDSNCALYKRLSDDVAFIKETNASSLDAIQNLCLGYSAVIRVLWPCNISIDVRGQEVRVINCHHSHIPRERLEQLEFITAAAMQENAWVVGDLNIDDQSTSDTASSSVEALTELMEQTALVDVATLFNAAHLPIRVASCRRQVDTARLDRILLPSRLLERETLYKTIYYRLSDDRAVFVQLGSPPFPRQPYLAAMLRTVLVDEYLLATIKRTSESIADMSCEALWISSSKIKAELFRGDKITPCLKRRRRRPHLARRAISEGQPGGRIVSRRLPIAARPCAFASRPKARLHEHPG